MQIRLAERDDILQLLELYRHLNPEEESPAIALAEESWETFRRYPGSGIFIGIADGAVVTSCTLVVIPI